MRATWAAALPRDRVDSASAVDTELHLGTRRPYRSPSRRRPSSRIAKRDRAHLDGGREKYDTSQEEHGYRNEKPQ